MEFANDVRYPPFKNSKLKDFLYTLVLYNSGGFYQSESETDIPTISIKVLTK